METNKRIATFHLPQPVPQLSSVLFALERQYPGAFVKECIYGEVLEVWAPKTAVLEILDADLDEPEVDELDPAEIAKANGSR